MVVYGFGDPVEFQKFGASYPSLFSAKAVEPFSQCLVYILFIVLNNLVCHRHAQNKVVF